MPQISFGTQPQGIAPEGFVDRLAHDDEFRELLANDPVEALASVGIEISADLLPERFELPSMEEVHAAFYDEQAIWPGGGGAGFMTCLCLGIAFTAAAQETESRPEATA